MGSTQILSIICIVDGRQQDPVRLLRELHESASSLPMPFEIVVIVNGAPSQLLGAVRSLTRTLDSLQIYIIKRRVDYLTAVLAGLENAIGDWVATLDLARNDAKIVRDLMRSAEQNQCEVAVAAPIGSRRRGPADALLSSTFHLAFRSLHGYNLARESPTARLMSRAVLNDILQHDAPLIALETLTATYSKATVPVARRTAANLPIAERVKVRWRTLIGINAAPLRIANLVCSLGASAALAYSVYVVVVYLVKSDVVPGWTTVSLIISAMFLTVSLVLGMLSEYLILLLDVGARRGRYEIVEELSSGVQPRSKLLNVETQL